MVQSVVRGQAGRKNEILWRNNVGACKDDRGNHIRYGLANESKRVNSVFKSGDLVGIRSVVITPDMVGKVIGQFVSREIKKPGWNYRGTDREKAQMNWATLVMLHGGDATFVTGE